MTAVNKVSYNRKKIVDEFTNLPVSRQRKWQLRHREQHHEMDKRWRNSDTGKKSKQLSNKRYLLKKLELEATDLNKSNKSSGE